MTHRRALATFLATDPLAPMVVGGPGLFATVSLLAAGQIQMGILAGTVTLLSGLLTAHRLGAGGR
jgi:hypothetical protein